MGKHWIILVNRSPKGPLSLEEVNALLQDKLISRTDLALEISDKEDQKNSWKFLWQFPEFDLRAQNGQSQKAETQPSIEQRKQLNPQEVQKKISSILPDEIALINPEDLILTAKKTRSKSSGTGYLEQGVTELDYTDDSASSAVQGLRWGYAFVALSLLVVGVYVKDIFFSGNSMPVNQVSFGKNAPSRKPVLRIPAKAEPSPSLKTPLKTEVSNANPDGLGGGVKPVETKEAPQPPLANVITLDEYQKMKEANAAKEKNEEEDKRRAIEESEELVAQKADEDTVASDENSGEESGVEGGRAKPFKQKKQKIRSSKRKVAEENEESVNDEERRNAESDNTVEE